jgi:osmotically-inducible protein OsmY
VVTLRGDVRSNAEREAVERHAQHATGVERVENLLSVDADEDE